MYVCIYAGLEISGISYRQMQITFRVIANHFSKVICQIF